MTFGRDRNAEGSRLQAPAHKTRRAVVAVLPAVPLPSWVTTQRVAQCHQMLGFSTVKTKWETACDSPPRDADFKAVLTHIHFLPSLRLLLVHGTGQRSPGAPAGRSTAAQHPHSPVVSRQSAGLEAPLPVDRRGFLPQGSDWTFPW